MRINSLVYFHIEYIELQYISAHSRLMIVQDAEIVPSSLTEIFKNADQRQRILKIIIQTLYNLGYEQSAAELQAQSKIIYLTQEVREIKQALPLENYEHVQKLLSSANKHHLVKDVLSQLKCMKMIREGKMQQALNLIQNQIKQPKRQNQLSEELMIGTGILDPAQIKKKHDFIIETCFDGDVAPNSMLKMINCYIQLQKRGLTNGISPQFSLLKKPSMLKRPPIKIIQTATSFHIKSILFIRFNRKCSKILVVSFHKKQKYLSIWNFSKQKQAITQQKNCSFTIDEEIVNISWSYETPQQKQMISIATNNHVCIFSHDLKMKHKKKIGNGHHHNNKILCLNWNSFTNFLYVGGSFQHIKVYGSTLDEIVTLQPFIRTRNIYFNHEGTHMYAISATKGLFIYFNLFEQKQQAQFVTEDIITSFRLQNRDKSIILVTQKKILYIAVQNDKTYQILVAFDNIFSQNGLVEIEACLYDPWIICLGNKQFLALCTEKNSKESNLIPASKNNQNRKQQKWNSKQSFTFDIGEGVMVSGSRQLYLWSTHDFQDAPQIFQDEREQMQAEPQMAEAPVENLINQNQAMEDNQIYEDSQLQDNDPDIQEDDY